MSDGSAASWGSSGAEARALVVPLGNIGARADLHPADRLLPGHRQHPGRRTGLDSRPDDGLVAVLVILLPDRRRQAEIRAPTAVAGPLPAEQVFKLRPAFRRRRDDLNLFSPSTIPNHQAVSKRSTSARSRRSVSPRHRPARPGRGPGRRRRPAPGRCGRDRPAAGSSRHRRAPAWLRRGRPAPA
jgi:hypothetical protein